jgi:hypothetical protein
LSWATAARSSASWLLQRRVRRQQALNQGLKVAARQG